MGRLPAVADFPAGAKVNIVPPIWLTSVLPQAPASDPPTNVLLLLHGLGDTVASFSQLAAQLRLPETVCIAVQALHPLLDLGGFHWGDDIVFDSSNGGLDADGGFKATTAFLQSAVRDGLIGKCGFAAREVMLFGFGQGGMAALSLGVEEQELGGIVSIGAPLPAAAPAEREPKCRTPVLVCAGAEEASIVTPGAEDKLKRVFGFVELVRYRRPGDGMPKDRGEMLPVMQFFARRLRSVKGVPKDSIEIG